MNKLLLTSVLGVVISTGLVTMALPAYAAETTRVDLHSSLSQAGESVLGASADVINRADEALYRALNREGKTNIRFQPHARVCSVAGDGEAACNARVITDNAGAPKASVTTPTGYGPKQFRSAYGVSGTASGHPVIAIVDAYDDPYIVRDLATYSAAFGIPSLPTCSGAIKNSSVPCFQKVGQSGSTTRLPSSNSGWALEISLDVQAAHALCQNCGILLVEANSASYTNLMAAVDTAVNLGGNVVSNSYGSSEFSGETSYDSHFNHPGVAFTVSSGDSGYGAQYPAASKYVTAVGGTSLFLNTDGSYASESAWSGSGSGCSTYEGKPTWQLDSGCAKRTIADVSADADPNTGAAVYDSFRYSGRSGWFQVGGTSLASPLIAATYALSGTLPVGTQENSLPYGMPSALHDVLSGTNGTCTPGYLCTATNGYDGPTGLGTPFGTTAF